MQTTSTNNMDSPHWSAVDAAKDQPDWAKRLYILRKNGRARTAKKKTSSTLTPCVPFMRSKWDDSSNQLKGWTCIDIGCGDSYDRFAITDLLDHHSCIGIDRYPVDDPRQMIVWDARKGLPFGDRSVDLILCHAAIGLFTEDERAALYKECSRIAKFHCVFSITYSPLVWGYPYDAQKEHDELRRNGWGTCNVGRAWLYAPDTAAFRTWLKYCNR